jgi:hypothetical protein
MFVTANMDKPNVRVIKDTVLADRSNVKESSLLLYNILQSHMVYSDCLYYWILNVEILLPQESR